MSLFPIKPIGCCDRGKCYVSQGEFNTLSAKVAVIDSDVEDLMDKSMTTVDFTVDGGIISIGDIIPGIYVITDDNSTYVLTISGNESAEAIVLSTVGAYVSGGVFRVSVAVATVSTDLTIRPYSIEGASKSFTESAEVHLIPF